MRCAVLTRFHNECPFFQFFVSYYTVLGFHTIFMQISRQDYHLCSLYTNMRNAHVHLVLSQVNMGNDKTLLQSVASNFSFDWYLHVDMDEFLILDVPTIQQYVDSLRNETSLIQFRWAMIEWFAPHCTSHGLPFLLNRTKVYSNMHMKSMMKGLKNVTLKNHNVAQTHGPRQLFRIFRDCAYSKSESPPALVTRGACYKRGFLLHIDTRSVTNLFTKWLGWHESNSKHIQSPQYLLSLQRSLASTMTLSNYTDLIKRKVLLFEYHTAFPLAQLPAFPLPNISFPFCNSTIEYWDLMRLAEKDMKLHIERLSALLMERYKNFL